MLVRKCVVEIESVFLCYRKCVRMCMRERECDSRETVVFERACRVLCVCV